MNDNSVLQVTHAQQYCRRHLWNDVDGLWGRQDQKDFPQVVLAEFQGWVEHEPCEMEVTLLDLIWAAERLVEFFSQPDPEFRKMPGNQVQMKGFYKLVSKSASSLLVSA